MQGLVFILQGSCGSPWISSQGAIGVLHSYYWAPLGAGDSGEVDPPDTGGVNQEAFRASRGFGSAGAVCRVTGRGFVCRKHSSGVRETADPID